MPKFWKKYRRIFSKEGLPAADPADLRAFGTDTSGSNLGRQGAFLSEQPKGILQPWQSRGNGIIRSVLWVAIFAVLAWLVVASWGLTFWPSVALFTVYKMRIVIPLGLTLGLFIPWGLAARNERDTTYTEKSTSS